MVDYSTTLIRAYSSDLIDYLVPLELDHMDHTTTTTFINVKFPFVDLTTGVQKILPYQYAWQII